MCRITFEEYKSAIKSKYQSYKLEDPTGILLNPSPAQLRNLCLMLFDNSLSINDENSLRVFLNVKEGEDLRRAIAKFEIAKFRPIISFLIGDKDSDNTARIELAAILVDFEKRPYNKFLKEEAIVKKPKNILEVPVQSAIKEETVVDLTTEIQQKAFVGNSTNYTVRGKPKPRIVYLVSAFSLIIFMAGLVVWNLYNVRDCMVWNEDHYEAVSCDEVPNSMSLLEPIVLKKEDGIILNFKKIKVCDTTSFFKMGKPCVWYGKCFDGNYEYFTAPGLHPETEKTLKPITQYIIDRHILKKKEN
ncbi:hypothetical protein [Flavobacterium sp. 140616W15]|uniref:hypothetical protein n=1 Tax=Flavobacterium sp. 140616W15 TaxID=2478552 RepID=UPI000F0CC7A4|nr:hypothetical protein [Flavobacterium sp. 140616W15]AYN04953.1 hypothetical protein EAG11_12885 [Flavobacterium sp. 140616W15]